MFEVVLKLKVSMFVCYLCEQGILFGAYRLGVFLGGSYRLGVLRL
jgi:hypothetical protein